MLRRGPQGSQKSFQKLIELPLLTVHLRPLTYAGPPTLQAAHILEHGKFLPPSVSLLVDKYFVVSIHAQSASCSNAKCQHSFANNA